MTSAQKILEIDAKLIDETETYEDIGIYLAYLYPAILKPDVIELNRSYPKAMDFLNVMERVFPARHWVWNYIIIRN